MTTLNFNMDAQHIFFTFSHISLTESVIPPTWVWNTSIGDNLVEQDTKRPNVWLVGEPSMADGLRSAPFVGNLFIFCDVEWLLNKKHMALKIFFLFFQQTHKNTSAPPPCLPWSLWPVRSRPPCRCSVLPPGRFELPNLCGCSSVPPGTTSHQPPGLPCRWGRRFLDVAPLDLKQEWRNGTKQG